jgi:environmental stress-induced protein Ves
VTGAERIDLRDLPARPWKNGGGTTREIACHPPGAGYDTFDWRLSIADVSRDGPFSSFPGVDRTIVLLEGAGMRLRDAASGAERSLTGAGAWLAFAGEAAIDATLVAGATRDFNLMTRRGRCSATVDVLRAPASIAAADALLLCCLDGRWRVDPQPPLAPGQMLLWRAAAPAVAVEPHDAGAPGRLLAVRLCQDRR